MATITSLGFTIFSKYVGTGVKQAEQSLDRLDKRLRDTNTSMGNLGGRTSLLITSLVALAPAVAPVVAATAAVTAGLAAMSVGAGIAGGVFGIVAAGIVKKTLDMEKAGQQLSPIQRVFITNVNDMKSAWDRLLMSTADKTLLVAVDVVSALTAGIGRMGPIVDAVFPSIKRVSQAFQDWMQGDGLTRFVNNIVQYGVPSLDAMLRAGRDVLAVLGFGFRSFLPLGEQIAEVIARGAAALRGWAEGGGFDRFMAGVVANGPMIREFFAALWAALKNVISALAQLGPIALGTLTIILQLIASMDPKVVQGFFLAFVGFNILSSVIGAVGTLTAAVKLLMTVLGFFLTPAGLVVLAIAAIIAIIVLIATKTTWFQDLWAAAWPVIKSTAEAVWTWMKQAWDVLWNGMISVFNTLFPPIEKAFRTVWPELVAAAVVVWDFLRAKWAEVWSNVQSVWTFFVGAFGPVFRAAWEFLVTYASGAWEIFKAFWSMLWAGVTVVFLGFAAIFTGDWSKFWTALKDYAASVWNLITVAWEQLWNLFPAALRLGGAVISALWQTLWAGIQFVASTIWGLIVGAWQAFWGLIQSIADTVHNAIKAGLQAFWNWIVSIFRDAGSEVQGVWSAAWDAVSTRAQIFWDWIKGIFQTSLDFLRNLWQTVWGAVTDAWNATLNAIKTAWDTVLKPVFDAIGFAAGLLMTILLTVLITPFKIAWDALVIGAKQAWESVLKPAWDAIAAAALWLWTNAISPAFNGIRDTIVTIFTTIRDYLSAWWTFTSNLFTTALNALQAFWQMIWTAVSNFTQTLWNALKDFAQGWWNSITAMFTLALNNLQAFWQMIWTAVQNFTQTLWNNLKAFAQAWWNSITQMFTLALNNLQAFWQMIWNAISTFTNNLWNALRTAAQNWWNLITSMFTLALNALHTLWQTIWTAIQTFAQTVWNTLVNAANAFWGQIRGLFDAGSNWLRTTFWNPVHDFFTRIIPDAFNAAVGAIGRAWESIKGVVRAPIQAVIDVVYNRGIVPVWNGVAGTFGAPKLGTYNLPNFAAGGPVRGPGTGTSDSIMARVSNNEHIWTAEEVNAAGGHKAVAALRSMVLGGKQVRAMAAATNGFGFAEGGGWWSDVTNFISGGISKLKGLVLGGIHSVVAPMIDGAANIGKTAVRAIVPGSPPLEGMAVGMIDKMANAVKDWIKGKDVAPVADFGSGGAGVAGSIPTGDRRAVIEAALRAAGVPPPGSLEQWLVGMNTLITRESGWNPNARNLWDINARNGIPSGGLAQVIGPTFAANHVPGTSNNLFDPVANVAAAVRYITRRYGSITNVQQANANLPPRGYALGTQGANRGWAWAGENGRELIKFRGGEKVLSNQDSMALVGGGRGDHFEVNIPIDARGGYVDPEAVRAIESELVPRLRMAIQQQVGKRSR